jgi:8-oxo-dGTP pyrophosphatase MutT (NUDIX family)
LAADQLLEIVDEEGHVVGEAMRSVIHKEGLLHREVHVFVMTHERDVIFQRRAPQKDWGGWLDATAGGHVEPGQTLEIAALMELQEETGIQAQAEDLVLLGTIRNNVKDKEKGMTNNVIRGVFGYKWPVSARDLAIEDKEGAGFVVVPQAQLLAMKPENAPDFQIIPRLTESDYQLAFRAFIQQ